MVKLPLKVLDSDQIQTLSKASAKKSRVSICATNILADTLWKHIFVIFYLVVLGRTVLAFVRRSAEKNWSLT